MMWQCYPDVDAYLAGGGEGVRDGEEWWDGGGFAGKRVAAVDRPQRAVPTIPLGPFSSEPRGSGTRSTAKLRTSLPSRYYHHPNFHPLHLQQKMADAAPRGRGGFGRDRGGRGGRGRRGPRRGGDEKQEWGEFHAAGAAMASTTVVATKREAN